MRRPKIGVIDWKLLLQHEVPIKQWLLMFDGLAIINFSVITLPLLGLLTKRGSAIPKNITCPGAAARS